MTPNHLLPFPRLLVMLLCGKETTQTGLKKQLKVPCFAFVKKICFLAGVLLLSFLWLYVEPDGPAVIMTDGSIRGHIFFLFFPQSFNPHNFVFNLTPLSS
jgi:hypothetical protein